MTLEIFFASLCASREIGELARKLNVAPSRLNDREIESGVRSRYGIAGEIDGKGFKGGSGVGAGIDSEHGAVDCAARDLEEEVAIAFEGFDEDMIPGLLSGGGGDGLVVDATGAGDDVGDLEGSASEGELAGVTLVAVGVAGEEEIRHHAGLLADGVDVGEHSRTGSVSAGGEGRVVSGEDERLAGADLALGGDGLEGLEKARSSGPGRVWRRR